jgi:hypothetical protein
MSPRRHSVPWGHTHPPLLTDHLGLACIPVELPTVEKCMSPRRDVPKACPLHYGLGYQVVSTLRFDFPTFRL